MSITNVPIDNVVQVNITKQTVVPSQLDFGLLCLLSENLTVIPVNTRYKIYTSLASVLSDFGSSAPEYIFAQSFFSQVPTPQRLMISCVDTTNETYPEAIQAAYDLQTFYAISNVNLSLSNSVVQAIALYVQTQIMIFFYQTSDSTVLTNVTNDLASLLQQANSYRTIVSWYESTNTTTRFDGAWSGFGLSKQPGTFNWANKTLVSVLPTSATLDQINIGQGKGVNFYMQIGGVNITRLGNTSGTPSGIVYIDEVTGIDWLTINLQTQVYQLIASLDKVPYTDAGLNAIEGAIMNVLIAAVDLGILADDPFPSVSHLPVSQVPLSDRQARRSPTFNFTARLAGAVNFVTINGVLTV